MSIAGVEASSDIRKVAITVRRGAGRTLEQTLRLFMRLLNAWAGNPPTLPDAPTIHAVAVLNNRRNISIHPRPAPAV
jgi:hypothetical protein